MRLLPVGSRLVDLDLDLGRGGFCDDEEEEGGEWKGQPVGSRNGGCWCGADMD